MANNGSSRRTNKWLWMWIAISIGQLQLATVSHASQALTFTLEPQDSVVPEGHSVLLQCAGKAAGKGKATPTTTSIRWRGPDGQDLGVVGDTFRTQLKNGSLYISSVEENRGLTGAYQCLLSADGVGSVLSRPALVAIARQPELNQDFIETYLLPGQTAYFRCMVGDHVWQPGLKHTVQWYKDDMPLPLDKLRMVVLPNGALEIDEVGPSDRGAYQCNVTSGSAFRLSSKTNLNIKKGAESGMDQTMAPSFLVGPSPKTVSEGDTVTLDCVANGVPKPQIKWLRNGEELDLNHLDSRFSITGTGSLQISSAEDIDSGNYQCRASNTVDSLDAQATVQVQVPPKFIQAPRDKTASEKEVLNLECSIHGKPKPSIRWLKNGDVITPNEYMQFVNGHNLRIHGLLYSDAGMFQCIGTNPAGSVQASARLRVVAPGAKLKQRKSQGQTTKSLQSFDSSTKRRRPSNSGELRTKSGGSRFPDRDTDEDDYNYANDKSAELPQRNLRNMLRPVVQQADEAGALRRQGQSNDADEDADDDADDDDDDYDETGTKLPSWSNKNRKSQQQQQQQQMPPTSNFASTDLTAGDDHTGDAKPLSSGLLARLPSAPRNLVAQIVKPRFVTLSWQEPQLNANEVVSYTVYYRVTNSEREQKIVTQSHEDQQVSIQSLFPGRTYQFRVVANTNFGIGESSQALEASTQPEVNIAGPPRNIDAYARNHKEIFVHWSPPSVTNGEINKYRVYYTENDSGAELYNDSKSLELTLTDLRPYTDYVISVVPFNHNGMGDPSAELKVKTFSSTPSEPPNNVTLEVTSSSSITVHWEPPAEEDRNGQITGYKIRYRKLKDAPQVKSTPANIRYFELNALERNAEYQVKIAAMTVNGSGPFTEWYRANTLENDLDETQVPGKPIWINIQPGASKIELHWGPPQQPEIKIRNYVLGWGRGIPDENMLELKETERYHVLKGLESNTEYVVSLRARNVKGEGQPIYDNIKTREEEPMDVPVPLEVPVGLRAITMSSSSIVVYWTDTMLNKNQHVTDNRHYTVSYGITGSNRYRYHNTSELNCMINELRPNTQYEFAVKVVKGRRESAWSMSVLNSTHQNVPVTPPRDLNVRLDELNPQNVIIRWLPPKHTVGQITGYNVYYTSDMSKRDRDWMIEAFNGEETMLLLSTLKPHTTYYFKVQARTNKGSSNAPFSALATFTTSAGVIMQPPDTIAKGIDNQNLLYIIIGGTALVLLLLLLGLLLLCRRKPQSSPEHTKKSYQKNNVGVPKPPDLWIHHDQMELKNIDKGLHTATPVCSDNASSSGALTLPRSVVHSEYEVETPVPAHVTNSLDKRSYVAGYMTATSMNSTMERPQYPRTQYNHQNRSHMNMEAGLSQQSLTQPQNNSMAQTPEHPYGGYDANFCNAGYTGGQAGGNGAAGAGCVSTIESAKRGHPLKSFSVPGPPPTGAATPVNKHTPAVTIRPQNQSPYKKPSFSAATPNRLQGGSSVAHSTDEIQRLAPSTSTEELNQEMANLEGLMKDLSAITANEFEC
ncbi:neogenin isoform X1 [Drosophila albomicans]|uniref:Neogenin isoform X1 n=1 Tax=Drosophila albomicans TaxID=7291 RepID=A0A6P8X3K7_DROAB|nr:neogenin isoform X1 [Drosophila albomicans]